MTPRIKRFPRTAIPHLLFEIGQLHRPILIISLVGQDIPDLSVSIGESVEQIFLNPFAESFQILWLQGLHVFAGNGNVSKVLTEVSGLAHISCV